MARFSPTLTSRAVGKSAFGFGMDASLMPLWRLVILAETLHHFTFMQRIFHQFTLPTHRGSDLASLRLPLAIPWALWVH